MTLIELVVVITILAIVAGVALLRAGDVDAVARIDTTRASLAMLRTAIAGPAERPGFADDLGEIPNTVADLLRAPSALPSGGLVAPYDPVRKRGWNGPYLLVATGTYATDSEHGFESAYGVTGDPAMIDSWGRPIVLQIPNGPASLPEREQYARLVSAGPDGTIATDPDLFAPDITNPTHVGDDVVVYVFRSNGF